MEKVTDIRPSPIAGSGWYSANPHKLSEQIDNYLQEAQLPVLDGQVIALIAPHAGLVYSGRTAGHAFRSVLGKKVDLVVVVSPLHSYAPSPLLTSAHRAYATPLGSIPIDQDALNILQQNLALDHESLTAIAYDNEHSLEIELPFLQRAISGDFQILPIMICARSAETARRLGHALAKTLADRSTLVVASSDLSHYKPLKTAERLDGEILRHMAAFSPEGVIAAEESGAGSACGAYPIASVLWAAKELGANAVEVVHHSTSGDETGDFNSVVGYGAAVILKRP